MKQILLRLFIVSIIFGLQSQFFSQQNTLADTTHQNIELQTNQIYNKIVQIRRTIHENPELAGKEKNTQEVIKKYLQDLGLQVQTDIYGYSIVGILKGGKKGKNIVWRSDMDALANDFPDDVEFKSKIKGIQHGCGHDVHMAIALGIAEVLSKNKKDLQGTIYFIFQPEEETFVGAKKMIENGFITKFKPEEIYGLHVAAFPSGQILLKKSEIFAYQKVVRIQFKNTLSPEEVQKLTKNIQGTLMRTIEGSKPWDIQSIIDPKIGVTNPNTIFKDYLITNRFANHSKNNTLSLEFEVYETDAAKLKNIIPTIQQVVKDQNLLSKLISIDYIMQNPTINNHPKLTQAAVDIIQKNYGKESIVQDYGQIPYFNDDFAYFQQKIPGVYFILGGSDFDKGIIAMNHAPNFRVDEECMKTAVKTFASLLYERLILNTELISIEKMSEYEIISSY